MNIKKLSSVFVVLALTLFTACSNSNNDATLKDTSTVKGETVTDLGTPSSTLNDVVAGTVTITATQAANTSNTGSFITLFDPTNAEATVKVVKYANGADTTNFETDTAYANQAITTLDFFIIKVTAQDEIASLFYKVVVTVTPAPILSNIATVTSATYTVSAGGTPNETIIDLDKGVTSTDFLDALTKGESHQTWNSTGVHSTVADGDTLVVTAQDGTTTVTYTIAVPSKAIGESYEGGIVAYVLKSADPGYVLGETHGLIATTANNTNAVWISGAPGIDWTLNGNTLTALGTGLENTNAMRAQAGYTGGGAKVCYDYSTGGGADLHLWYLPSQAELNKFYLNKVAIGGFVTNLYLSSSERNATSFYYQDFTNGNSDGLTKSILCFVRCAKTF